MTNNQLQEDLLDYIKTLSKEDKISYYKRLEIRDTMILFANEHHHNTKGEPLRFDTYPHLVELYEEGALHKDIVIMAGTQVGKTDWLIVYCLAAAYCGLNVFFILPKDEFRDTFVTEKVLKTIKLSPFYTSVVSEGISKSKDLINFGRGMIKFVGGRSETNFVSFSGDIIVCDETDQLSEPKNIDVGMGRLNNSDFRFSRFVSNPSNSGGFIFKRYELSDKRVRKYPCSKCGKLQEINFFKNIISLILDDEGNVIGHNLKDKDYVSGDTRDIYAICEEECCGGVLDRASKESRWEATAFSERGLVGYKMPSFCNPRRPLIEIYNKYCDAVNSPSAMEAFYMTELAEPYVTAGNKVSEDILSNCVEKGYLFVLEADQAYSHYSLKKPCVMGVDTATNHWDISISHQEKISSEELHRLVFIGKMNPKDGLYFLHDLVERYNVICVVIDMQPETLPVMQFQQEAKCVVWRCDFWNTSGRDTEYVDDSGKVMTNRREMLDKSYSILRQKKLIIPENYKDILQGLYTKEMMALTRIVEQNTKGVWVPKWVGPSEDHQRLADGYRNLARETTTQSILTAENNLYIG